MGLNYHHLAGWGVIISWPEGLGSLFWVYPFPDQPCRLFRYPADRQDELQTAIYLIGGST